MLKDSVKIIVGAALGASLVAGGDAIFAADRGIPMQASKYLDTAQANCIKTCVAGLSEKPEKVVLDADHVTNVYTVWQKLTDEQCVGKPCTEIPSGAVTREAPEDKP